MNEHERRGREIKFNDFDVLRCDSKKQIFLYFTVLSILFSIFHSEKKNILCVQINMFRVKRLKHIMERHFGIFFQHPSMTLCVCGSFFRIQQFQDEKRILFFSYLRNLTIEHINLLFCSVDLKPHIRPGAMKFEFVSVHFLLLCLSCDISISFRVVKLFSTYLQINLKSEPPWLRLRMHECCL